MNITEVQVKLVNKGYLKAFCSVIFDNMFVIRELRVIETPKGLFVSMPTRKVGDHCAECGMKNPYTAKFCQRCGIQLPDSRAPRDKNNKLVLYADVCHPINQDCRDLIQEAVLKAYNEEESASRQPGYKTKVYSKTRVNHSYNHEVNSVGSR